MTITIQRISPAGTYLNTDVAPLHDEISADATVGATLLGITLYQNPGDDTVDYLFDSAPNEVALDACIAAYPSFTPGIADSWIIVSNTYSNIFETDLAEGEALGAFITLLVAFSTGSVDESFMTISCSARREVGGSTSVSSPVISVAGHIPGLQIQSEAVGNRMVIKFKMRREGTLNVVSKSIDVLRGRI